ncbi:MAG: hypothetical protein H8E12_16850 [Rhodobacteraceae bacterium]|nr:hypothetical protein [Paracoccaceae bacterium]
MQEDKSNEDIFEAIDFKLKKHSQSDEIQHIDTLREDGKEDTDELDD